MEYKLSDIFDLQMGKTPDRHNPAYWNSNDEAWISIADLSKCNKYIDNTAESISKLAVNESGIKLIPKDTVIMSFKLSIGKVAITPRPMYSNEAIMAFIDKKVTSIIPEYLYYLLKSKDWEEGTNKAVMGKTLNKATLSQVVVSIHSPSEQQEIVYMLEKAERLILYRKQQLDELDLLIKARFVEMFGDKNAFEKQPLSNNVEEMFIGPFGSALKNECFVAKEDGYCIVYEQKHAIRKTMDVETRYIDKQKYIELKRFSVYGGDIIVSCRGTIGEIFIVPEDAPLGIMHPSIMKIRLKSDRYNKQFFAFALENYMRENNNKVNGSGVKMAVTATTLGKEQFVIPPLALQNQFAAFVDQVDKSKAVKEI